MDEIGRGRRVMAVALLGFAATVWHVGYNLRFKHPGGPFGDWDPQLPWLVPFVAVLPLLAVWWGVAEAVRRGGRRSSGIFGALIGLASITLAVATAWPFVVVM